MLKLFRKTLACAWLWSASALLVGAQVIFTAALRAMRGELTAGHGHERAVGAFDNLQVADNEAIVESNRTERLEALAAFFHQLDAHFSDFHGRSPCDTFPRLDSFETHLRSKLAMDRQLAARGLPSVGFHHSRFPPVPE